MAEAAVKFFLQRLELLLVQEMETFTGLKDQIEKMKNPLKEIGEFLGDRRTTEGDNNFQRWINKLKDLVHEMDDHVDEFIIQMDQDCGTDKLALIDGFRCELQKMENRLAETIQCMAELQFLTTIEDDKWEKEDDDKQSHGERRGQIESRDQNQGEEEAQTELSGTTNEEGGHMSSNPFRLKYKNLPYYLQSCLMYCCLFPENYWIHKRRLIRLLVAEGLIQEKDGHIYEDLAEENINQLISQGMLQVNNDRPRNGTEVALSSPYRMFLQKNLATAHANPEPTVPHTACRVLASDITKIVHNLKNLRPRTLFLFGNQENSEGNWLNFKGARFLRVLDLEDTRIKSLPDEVADLIHLTYLGLKHTDITELPARIGKLRALQTLDIRWCGYLTALSNEVLILVRLRHLKMFKNMGVGGMKLPKGISKLKNLLTLTGVHVSTARELGELIQLTSLGVMDVAEENANELFASIMKMQGLLSLSLEVEFITSDHGYLFLLESFSPPPLLQKLRLEGRLEKIPNWLRSMENLTKLRLGFSRLSENPTAVLQFLPNLKNLTLWQACDVKQFGKEFCRPGGFPKLEILSIASHVLEEWIELEEGALPSLQFLHLHNCLRLRMLPEGLQFVTTLKHLDLLPLLDDHAERLKPDGGEENYKIKHIASISFILMSVVNSLANSAPQPSCSRQTSLNKASHP